MSPTLTALEEVVTRHGRAALDDPLTLTAALRSLTDPPADQDVTALADAARAGAADRLRGAVEDGATPEQALDTATDDASDRSRWAAAQIGAALGLLPRSLAEGLAVPEPAPASASAPESASAAAGSSDHGRGPGDPAGAGAAPVDGAGASGTLDASGDADTVRLVPPATPAGAPTGDGHREQAARPAGRKRVLLLVGTIVVLLLGVVGGALLLGGPGTGTDSTDAATADAPPGTAPPDAASDTPGGGTAAPEPAGDPRAAFTDPVLLATAEPYLRIPGTTCTRSEQTQVVVREQVVCKLGTSGAGIFARYFDPTSVTRLREIMGTDETVVPGSRRELRWEYVPGRPGVRAGIPVGQDRDGVGTRVRWLGLDPKVPLLYFDEEATGTVVQLSLLDGGDQEQLRRLWADPVG